MSNTSYALLNNSTDKHDVSLSVKEPAPSSSSTANPTEVSLSQRYTQIAIAVALYWYEEVLCNSSLSSVII